MKRASTTQNMRIIRQEGRETESCRQPFVDQALCMKTRNHLGVDVTVIGVVPGLSSILLCSLFFKMLLEPELHRPCHGRRESPQSIVDNAKRCPGQSQEIGEKRTCCLAVARPCLAHGSAARDRSGELEACSGLH